MSCIDLMAQLTQHPYLPQLYEHNNHFCRHLVWIIHNNIEKISYSIELPYQQFHVLMLVHCITTKIIWTSCLWCLCDPLSVIRDSKKRHIRKVLLSSYIIQVELYNIHVINASKPKHLIHTFVTINENIDIMSCTNPVGIIL